MNFRAKTTSFWLSLRPVLTLSKLRMRSQTNDRENDARLLWLPGRGGFKADPLVISSEQGTLLRPDETGSSPLREPQDAAQRSFYYPMQPKDQDGMEMGRR